MRQLAVALGLALVLSATLPGAAKGATVAVTYGVGEEPMGIAVDPNDGRVYVANSQPVSGPGSVAVITPGPTQPTPGSPRVVRIQTSSASDFVAVDATNHRLYSSNLAGTVEVFDLTTFVLQASLPVGGLGIAVDPATQRVYVAGGSSVAVIDGATNTVAQTLRRFRADSGSALPTIPRCTSSTSRTRAKPRQASSFLTIAIYPSSGKSI